MREFEAYSPEDTILLNLRENTKRHCVLTEQEISHLRDLAYEVTEGRNAQEALLSLSDLLSADALPLQNVILQNRDPIGRLQNEFHLRRKLLLCYLVCGLLRENQSLGYDAFFADSLSQADETPRIIYQKSGYADSAHLRFSSLFNATHTTYTHGFISACEDVYNGLCDYCILPLESSSEGLLRSFFKLILKYDLKIAATCDVSEKGDERITRFALLRRAILPVLHAPMSNMNFELAFPLASSRDITNLLSAASFFDIDILSVGTMPSDEDSCHPLVHAVFSLTHGDLEAFLTSLSMENPQYIPLGLYPHLSIKKERI